MWKINRILLLFILLMSIFIISFWQLLQSKWAGDFFSKKISATTKIRYKTEVSFERMKFDLYPPGIHFSNVKVDRYDKEKNSTSKLDVREIEIIIDIMDLFLNRVTIKDLNVLDGKIVIQDARMDLGSIKALNKEIEGEDGKDVKSNNDQNIKLEIIKILNQLKGGAGSTGLAESMGSINVNVNGSENIILKYLKQSSNIKIPFGIKNILLSKLLFKINEVEIDLNQINLNLWQRKLQTFLEIKNFNLARLLPIAETKIDSLAFFLQIDKDIEIKGLTAKIGDNFINFQGGVQFDENAKYGLDINGDFDLLVDIMAIKKVFNINKYIRFDQGKLSAKGKISRSLFNPDVVIEAKFKNVVSEYFKTNLLEFTLEKNRQNIWLTKLHVTDDQQKVQLVEKELAYDVVKKRFFPNKFIFEVLNVDTKNIFHFLEGKLDPLKGEVSGKVEILIDVLNNKLTITSLPDLLFKKFRLITGKKQKEILRNEDIILHSSNFDIDLKSGYLKFAADLSFRKSNIKAEGEITKEGLDIYTKDARINFSELGPIAGQVITGVGKVSLNVEGPFEDVQLDFDIDVDGAKVLGFNLGRLKSKLNLSIDKVLLSIENGSGLHGLSSYFVDGNIDFENSKINLMVNIANANYSDSLIIFEPLIKSLQKWLPQNNNDIKGSYSANVNIGGGFSVELLDVWGDISAEKLLLFGDEVENFGSKFSFANNKLEINEINFAKGDATLTGEYSRDFNNSYNKFEFILSGLEIWKTKYYERLNIGLKGILSGEWEGEGKSDELESELNLSLNNSDIGGKDVPDSELKIKFKNDSMFVKVKALDILEAKSFMDKSAKMEENKGQKTSYLKAKLYSENMPLILSFISPSLIKDATTRGGIFATLDSSFNYFKMSDLDLEISLDEFYFLRDKITLSAFKSKNIVSIKNGEIKNFDIAIKGDGGIIKAEGEGNLNSNFVIRSLLNVDSSILELAIDKIANTNGILENNLVITGGKDGVNYRMFAVANDLVINFNDLPGNIESLNYKLSYDKKKLVFEKFDGKFANGEMKVDGEIRFEGEKPEMNLNVNLKNSNLTFFERTNFLVSANGLLLGKAPPYLLSGNVSVLKGNMNDEFDNFSKKKKSVNTDNRFIPQLNYDVKKRLIALDCNLNLAEGISLKNSMASMIFTGKGSLKGFINSPKVIGQFVVSPGSGKFFFKSNDFNITKGSIRFLEEEEETIPELNFESVAKIVDYDVIMSIYGRATDFAVNLTSTPPLPKQEIMSLMMLGFTGDVSKKLSDEERQAVASVGIGGILFEKFDKFKFREGLSSLLGVKLSLAPEYSEESATISKKNATAGGSGSSGGGSTSSSSRYNRYRAATKVKAEKQISKKMTLTVSNTVGSSDEQKQEMNLNYDLSGRSSLEGVYEVKTGGPSVESYNSGGADIKFKWTFK
ncbi:MAG: translocation/assembly module TamB domain-containing protein [Oligoflexia bacterium]|nr:translocation/assembly module TamB domain-containing protein [Oligoflexia bacterium]